MPEVSFILQTFLGLLRFIVSLFLMRLILQVVRADFRNPVAQFIVRFTNPVVLPLRKILPPVGRTDTASVVAVLAAPCLITLLGSLFSGSGWLPPMALIATSVVQLALTTLGLYKIVIFIYVLMSWINTDHYNPASRLLRQVCEPVLAPFRRAVPLIGGMDLSPLVTLFVLQLLEIIVSYRIEPLVQSLTL